MARLSDFADIIMGQSPSGVRCYSVEKGLPLLNGPTEFRSNHPLPAQWTDDPKRIACAGDLLFCVRGSTTGRMNWADQDYAIGRGLAAIRHRSGSIFQAWIRGVIEIRLPDLLISATGSTFPNVSKDQLYSLDVPDHSLNEQREIAAILGVLDEKIEVNRKASTTLEEMARALYRSWFVDFDPVWAKLEGRRPAHMNAATAALFSDSFNDTGLPLLWRDGVLADLIEFNPKERLAKGASAPYFDMKALPTSGMTADAPILREFASGTKFRAMDTLLARITPCLENGKTAMIDNLGEHDVAWGSTEFIVMRAKEGTPASLPYCVARDQAFRKEAIATMTGSSGRQRADSERISGMAAAIPDPAILTAFGDATMPMIFKIHQFGRESRSLASLRDTLLPRLMSGELRVGEARELVDEVA
ncbi:MAG: restriction endonuclease subunit S [Paracoccus hibiscisoli]|uniref:restriction endonuclease subunit S n=1 Tax=Paracoccus hibiscisoli TaxID=2023261 RepID=UPI003919507E